MSRRLAGTPAWVVAAVLAAVYVAVSPPSADLAAQLYRTWLFEQIGPSVWEQRWYAGHHLPAYSVLFPPLAALLSPQLVGALAVAGAAAAGERMLLTVRGAAGRPAALWLAVALQASLWSGRLTFVLGLAFAAAALLAVVRRRVPLAVAAAVAAGLSSPVAGAFLALLVLVAAVSSGPHRPRWPAAAAVAAGAVVPAGVLSLAFPEGGTFPFVADAFWPSLAATLLVGALLPRRERLLRLGLAAYALVLAGSFLLETPMGGNAARLGALLAGPVAAAGLWPGHRRRLLLLAPVLVYWAAFTPVDDTVRAAGDPSVKPGYYRDLAAELTARKAFRVEVPFTDQHWESWLLGRHVALARGWERQLDRKVNALFYDGLPLTPARYERWLRESAVDYVALPDAALDSSAAAEAELVRRVPPFLREVWRDRHWRLFAVASPTQPVSGGGRLTAHGIDDLELAVPRPGRYVVRVRFTPYWNLTAGRGCVAPAGQWTAVTLRTAGTARLEPRFSPGRIRATSPRCTG